MVRSRRAACPGCSQEKGVAVKQQKYRIQVGYKWLQAILLLLSQFGHRLSKGPSLGLVPLFLLSIKHAQVKVNISIPPGKPEFSKAQMSHHAQGDSRCNLNDTHAACCTWSWRKALVSELCQPLSAPDNGFHKLHKSTWIVEYNM